MTALDQAFIKAFSQQGIPTATVLPRSATPISEHPPVPLVLEAPPAAPAATLDGVLAALEKPPRGITSLLKAEGHPEGTRRKAAEEARMEQCAVNIDQWAVGSGQWEAGSEEWVIGGGQYCPAPEPQLPSPVDPANPVDTTVPLPHQLDYPTPCPLSPLTDEDGQQPTSPLQTDEPLPAQPVQPAWRVDHFTWPKVCRRLMGRASGELDRLADALSAASTRGQKVLAIAGYRRGEGATTLLLCTARRLAERGIKLVLIDADLARPRLAKRLGVQPQFGWDETTGKEGASLAQAMVEAAANNLALLPLREPPSENGQPAGDPSRLAPCIEILRNQYDMVLVDLGPLEDTGLAGGAPARAVPETIDAIVLAHDQRVTSEEQILKVEEQLAAVGIAAVGIVENFVVEG